MKYCLEVKKIRTITDKIFVEADNAKDAINKGYKIAEKDKINMDNPIDDETKWEIDIDKWTCKDDETFDDEQFTQDGVQSFK
jgi:hypothetical protein